MANTSLSKRHDSLLVHRSILCTTQLSIGIGCMVFHMCLSSILVTLMRFRHSSAWDNPPSTRLPRMLQWFSHIHGRSLFPMIKMMYARTCVRSPSLGSVIGSMTFIWRLAVILSLSPRWMPDGRMALIILIPDLDMCLLVSSPPGRHALSRKLKLLIRGFTLSFSTSLDSFFSISLSVTMVIINYITINQNPRLHLFQVYRGLVSRFRVHRPRFDHHPWLVLFPSLLSFTSEHVSYSSICCCQHFQLVFITNFPYFLTKAYHSLVTLTTNAIHTIHMDRLFIRVIHIILGMGVFSCIPGYSLVCIGLILIETFSAWRSSCVGCPPSSSIVLPWSRSSCDTFFSFYTHVPIFIKTSFISHLTSLYPSTLSLPLCYLTFKPSSLPLFILDGRRRRDLLVVITKAPKKVSFLFLRFICLCS